MAEPAASPEVGAERQGKKFIYHYISEGETLQSLSLKYYGTAALAPEIARLNELKGARDFYRRPFVKIDPELKPQKAPEPEAGVEPQKEYFHHYVSPGETLMSISRKYYGTVRHYLKIAELNKIKDPDRLRPGVYIKIDPGLIEQKK